MAITKQQKDDLVAKYTDSANRSQAMIMAEYTGLNMNQFDALRAKLREVGSEFHVVKNTLAIIAMEQVGIDLPEDYLTGSTAICFAYDDAPGTAKVITEAMKASEFIKVKGGVLDKNPITADAVKALADLPPLPVMRAHLLGVLVAPATKLVRTISEPARGLAAVIQARNEAQPA